MITMLAALWFGAGFLTGETLVMLAAFLVVLGTTVVVHEFGHFAAAKWLGMKVEVFSVGFGKRLIGFKWKETDYRLSLLPLGGYVKITGMDPEEEAAQQRHPDAYLMRPKRHQLLVLVAGPAMNILLALAIPFVIGLFFFKAPAYLNQPAVVGAVPIGSSAEEAGIQPGDRIVKFAGVESPTWSKVRDYTAINDGKPVAVTVERAGRRIDLTLVPKARQQAGNIIGEAGLLPQDIPAAQPVVASVQPGTPAAQAGLQPQDRLLTFDGRPIPNFDWFKQSLQAYENRRVALTVERQGQIIELWLTPKRIDGEIRIGFVPVPPPPLPLVKERKSLLGAAQYAVQENIRFIVLTGEAFRQIFRGERKVSETLSGPIGIAKASGDAVKFGGLEGLFFIMGLLSLNLGIFNLLPIPVLDGGHIFLLALEAIAGWIGWRLTDEVKQRFNQAGFAVLMLLMVFVMFNDVTRFWWKPSPVEPPPPPEKPASAPPAPSR
ncbi:MAG: RIP metalloprotease RseP [Chloracidobacterium sp.]|nr:RIP metalloprotease RseP [Chloracidobacterium sp.]MDW8217067.1 RIP metalloprotease RseP [Acidobacteriota bacterium]